MDTVTNVSGSVVRQVDGTLALRQYKVGDYALGGIVFWVDESGEHGLVCDFVDISDGIVWGLVDHVKVTSARGDGIGAGEMNTLLIVAIEFRNQVLPDFAALICSNLNRSPYGDWYLPSKEELNFIYQNKAQIKCNFSSEWR